MAEGPEGEVAEELRPRRGRRRKASRGVHFWMLVTSLENFRRTQEQGFSVQGLRARHRRRAEAMRSGDRLLYYVSGRMAFAATCTLTSGMFEEHTHLWRSPHREEDYPWRVRIRPDVVLDERAWVRAKGLAYRLEYVRKWPPEHWFLAFMGHLHQLPARDFRLIEDELRRAESRAVAI